MVTASGWREAYRQFTADGWNSLTSDPAHGGQGLPRLLSALVDEMWNGANLSFALCPMLTRGAVEAIELRGSEALKRTYVHAGVTGTEQVVPPRRTTATAPWPEISTTQAADGPDPPPPSPCPAPASASAARLSAAPCSSALVDCQVTRPSGAPRCRSWAR